MPDGREPEKSEARTVKVLDSIHDVPAVAWDACAGGEDPFVSHAFLAALEDSGSVAPETGWMPRHLAVMGDDGETVIGCAPLYLKSHSYGEFVFDWGWADAFERAGGRYYPKLQAAVPFTPVTGRRLLLAPGAPRGNRRPPGRRHDPIGTAARSVLATRHLPDRGRMAESSDGSAC